MVIDKDTRSPLSGANVVLIYSDPLIGATADENGKFRLRSNTGRVSLKVSFLGYEDLIIKDILVATGKEIDLSLEMSEKVMTSGEIVVTASGNRQSSINPMASVSTSTVRANDALRYAGGFYDPSRIVNAFAGVATSNSDESNDIVIRGNSSRGLLWRLEGIEIPNPNHFGDGQGGSGGAYSAITSNVISTFDFFTGAFPSEYGNAISGVMDLNLRKGNPDKNEYAFQTGMIGAELAAEGPLNKRNASSYLLNARYVNFSILSNLKLIDLGSTNYAPRSTDLVFNINLPGKRNTSINLFGFYGGSKLGKLAIRDTSQWTTDDDRWEEMQGQTSSVVGMKYIKPLRDGTGYIRSVAAFTNFTDSYSEGYVDSSFIRNESYHHNYSYPSLRFSFMVNSKLSHRDIIRIGTNIQFLAAQMDQWRIKSSGLKEVLVEPSGSGLMSQFYLQLKNKIGEKLELNSGLHVMIFTVNGDLTIEPRAGIRWNIKSGVTIVAGMGLHSRAEAFPVYYNKIQNSQGRTGLYNKHLGLTKSFQMVAGTEIQIFPSLSLRAEIYDQILFNVPVIRNKNSTYSSLNTSEELPSSVLSNIGSGYNRGIELTLTKLFSDNYYFLLTGSLFNSKYKPGDDNWYNTYYNTTYVSNFLAGKDFYFGRNNRSVFGINIKSLFRGGYRYTPVDYEKTLKSKRVYFDVTRTYKEQLPDFIRIDAGASYRRNNPGYSFMIMLDVQNVTGRKNIFRKRFSYENNRIIETNVYSLGAVPVVNLRIEF
jgi:hypothetical protein